MSRDSGVVILGGGLAGLAAAQALERRGIGATVYERGAAPGGMASSDRLEGFTFDHGPHVSFTKREAIRALLAEALGGHYWEHRSELLNLWRGHWIRHPAQCHLHGLPVDLVEACIADFVDVHLTDPGVPATYAEWCESGLGKAFSSEFSFRYTRKYWAAEAAQLTAEWVGQRVHRPSLREVLRGALSPQRGDQHYISTFRYPHQGGFGAYLAAVGSRARVELGHEVVQVDLQQRTVAFAGGREERYERLISSLPLPELIARVKDAPATVRDAAGRLACTSLVLVDIGIDRTDGLPDAQWMYFYDEDVLFARLNLPHRLSPGNAPDGCGSLQAEVYHSRYRPLQVADVLTRVVDDLRRAGVLRADDRIRVVRERRVPYANVLFDHAREAALTEVNAFLEASGVTRCGRYGEWGYLWTDDAILSGWRAGDEVAGRLDAGGSPE